MTEQPENQAEQPGEVPEDQQAPGYRESPDHVPDPTAMSGTLETSGTGGGDNDRITGSTRIFGRAKTDAPGPDEGDPGADSPETDAKHPAKKTAAKK